ncbi:MAG: fibronectin type III domain-containing protein [Pseudomonadota bacterium]
MPKFRANPSLFRHFVAAVWAMLLLGCIPQPVTPPAGAPSGFTAVAGNATVTLSWAATTGAAGYSLRRGTARGGPYTQIATPAVTSYTDSTVTNGTTYYYVVSAFNNGGVTADSAEVSAIPAIPSIPLAPTNVAATVGDKSVSLSWTASTSATSYLVKRATTSGGQYTQIATVTMTSYVDSPLTNGTTYYYVVSAVNTLGESPNSTQVSATPSPPPPTTFGTWTNVTPSNADPNSAPCGFPGVSSVQADPAHPSNLYVQVHCQGIWKSVDYGASWTGPINTGTNGTQSRDCDGVITISKASTASVPTIFQVCVRGNAQGFWKSIDGGVNWTTYAITPTARQDYLHPVVDPYDQNHLLLTGHEFDSLVESFDGGQTWSSVTVNSQMLQSGSNSYTEFLDTGSATTTRKTWLWISEGFGIGTWRTTDSGATWTKVDGNGVFASSPQIHQPDKNGAVFIAGTGSALGEGVQRSSDYGRTWTHVGITTTESIVFGSSKNVYSMCNCSNGGFQVGTLPGTGTWVAPGALAGPTIPPAGQVAVVNDGTHNILVGAMWNSGVWRYIEP